MMTREIMDRACSVSRQCALVLAAWLGVCCGVDAQQRSMAQDPTLNNLLHAPGTETVESGELGRVRKVGSGPRVILLIPGLGFGDEIWTEFMERHASDYTMYAITLPGFGGTKPLATPQQDAPISDIPWTRSALQGIEALLDREGIARATIIAHWIHGTQLALHLASMRPNGIEAVILIGGVLKSYFASVPGSMDWTREQRWKNTEAWASRWFRTVTRDTWDDNNFMPYDYAVNPRRGLDLWRQAQAPPLSVWVRYLLEFWSMDSASLLKELQAPVLLIQPGFDDPDYYVEPNADYMRNLCIDSWAGASEQTSMLEVATVPKSRLFVMYDRPAEMDELIDDFLRRSPKIPSLPRENPDSVDDMNP